MPALPHHTPDLTARPVSAVARPHGVSLLAHRRYALFAIIGCVAYICMHIATVTRSRQAYFDDTFFASVGDTFVRTGELKLSVSPLWLDQPVYLYGPIYFLILGSVFEHFGMGIIQVRLPGLLFGFAVIAIAFAILRRERTNPTISIAACTLLALDPNFHQSIHSGRMDSIALFLMLASFFLLLLSRDADRISSRYWCLASGIVAGCAILTTPRPGYLMLPMALILLLRWYRSKSGYIPLGLILWGTASLSVLVIWVWYAFGSIDNLLTYYSHFSQYAGIGSRIKPIHVPLVLSFASLLGITIIHKPRQIFDEVTILASLGTAGYYVFVHDTPFSGRIVSSYTVFMVILAYIGLARVASLYSELTISQRTRMIVLRTVFGVLLLINGSIFLGRTTLDLLEWQRRSPQVAEEVIEELIPPGSRVIGDESFYFAVRKNGSDFQYLERGGTLAERVAYHTKIYDFDYMITNFDDDSEIVRAYAEETPVRKVTEIQAPRARRLAELIVSLGRRLGLRDTVRSGYEATIFVRAR